MKLHVYVRNLGIASRRRAEELIAEGRILVNGNEAHIGQVVQGDEEILFDKQIYKASAEQKEFSYLLVNKPIGYTSTTVDFFTNEKSVLELLPLTLRKQVKWQIVGRLDKNSQGLILLTDNGAVSYVMTHPKFQVQKEYEVVSSKALQKKELDQLVSGVTSILGEEYKFQKITETAPKIYRCILNEGKKREIREAFAILGGHVQKLTRIRLGVLLLGDLPLGEYRDLSNEEKKEILAVVERVDDSIDKEL